MTNRYYDPGTVRFLTRDPIGYEGGINLYGFCAGNPINNTDPFGTQGEWSWSTYFNDVGGVFRGYGSAILGTVRSPITTMEFLGTWSGTGWSVDYAKEVIGATWSDFVTGITGERGAEGFGESFGTTLIIAGSAGAGFAEGGAFSRTAYITRWDTPEGLTAIRNSGHLRAGSFVQEGIGTPIDYMFTGVVQLGYKYTDKITVKVPRSALKAPKGWEKTKALIGQRQLKNNVEIPKK